MNLSFSLYQAVTVGPRIALRKLLRKLRHSVIRRSPASPHHHTFTALQSASPLAWQSQVALPSRERLHDYAKEYRRVADGAAKQHLWIAGEGLLLCTHHASPPGIDGVRFDSSPPAVPFAATTEFIASIINAGNVHEACRRYALLPTHYCPIDWQRDARSGYTWSEGVPSSTLRITPERGADPKCAWDMARMHHLLHLAFAHALATTDEQRASIVSTFRSHVIDFLALNPPGYGIQWTVPMEVAIRVANILVAADFFLQQGVVFDEPFRGLLQQGVHEHASWILDHLEWSDGMRGNHYLSNLAGLSVCAAYLDSCALKERILDTLHRSLDAECLYQFHNDGSHFEASLHYHVFSTEMLAWSYFFVAKAQPQYRILPHVQDRLTSIAAFTNRIRNQRGLVPQLGDNDSGRFLPFLPMREQHAPWEHMMDRRDVCRLILEVSATSSPATLSPASAMLAEYQSNLSLPPSSYHADDFGLVILRTTHFEMYGRAGSIGQLGRGGHSHNDQLSLVLCVDGYEFICDPGTFIYTALPDQRNLFRSTAFHSTLVVGGREQHRIPSDMREGLFWVQSNNANASTLTCTHTEWVACHKGYGKIHTRRVAIDNSTIIVQDDCTLDLPKSIICMLHPTVEVHRVEKGVECTRDGRTLRIQSDDAISVENAWYSPEYGMRVPTTRLVMMMSSHRHEFRITRIEASTTSAS